MNFNKKSFELFREDVSKALQEVAKKHGVTIEPGKINYDEYSFDLNLKVTKSDSNVDGKKMLFEQHCAIYGFEKDDYEREFLLNGRRFKLIGFSSKSPKNCCNIQCLENEKLYKCTAESVKSAFRKAI